DVKTGERAQQRQSFARREAADLRRSGARRKGGIEAVDVYAHIHRSFADDLERTRGDGGNSERAELLDLDDRHAGCIGELPVEVCRTSNADLNRALRIQHSVEYGQAKGTSVMKFRAVEGAHRVAVRVDVHQADRALAPKRLENRVAHRMISAHRQRPHTPVGEAAVESFDILDRLLQTEAAAKGHVPDIRRLDASLRHAPLRGVVGPNALDVAHGARAE